MSSGYRPRPLLVVGADGAVVPVVTPPCFDALHRLCAGRFRYWGRGRWRPCLCDCHARRAS